MNHNRFTPLDRFAAIVTTIVSIAAIVCRAAAYVSPETGKLWVSLALVLPVVLLLAGAAVVWWLARNRPGMIWMPAIAILCNLGYISAKVQLPDFRDGSPSDLRVATLNAFNFSYLDSVSLAIDAVAAAADRERIELFCLQESLSATHPSFDRLRTALARRLPYVVHEEGQAIFSRYPILKHDYARFTDSWNDYLWADITVGCDTVRVVSVHLQTTGVESLRMNYRTEEKGPVPVDRLFGTVERNSRIRARQVEEILALADTTRLPLIVAGDFNDTPSSYTYRRMHNRLTDGFRVAGRGFERTFRPLGNVLRIDYIFCNDDFRFVGYRTLDDVVSDHRIVTAELQFRR